MPAEKKAREKARTNEEGKVVAEGWTRHYGGGRGPVVKEVGGDTARAIRHKVENTQ
ncbi:Hypothetical predicted protein [Pelobates cultripes]|uniref:Uncharacterized protein n=1 Tax=Pelobates cultripes TaxID=61616 RepID=A0AAD1R4B5_PELCU|nr:Hypothetical predicted protein [Pelobates cultripes]